MDNKSEAQLEFTPEKAKLGWTQLIPPILNAFHVVFSENPLGEVEKRIHNRFFISLALCAAIVLFIATYIAGSGAPLIDPYTQVWDYSLKPFFDPKIDYKAISVVVAAIFIVTGLTFLVCLSVAHSLTKNQASYRPVINNFLLDYAIVGSFLCICIIWIIQGFFWLISLKGHVTFAINYINGSTFLLTISLTIWLISILKNQNL